VTLLFILVLFGGFSSVEPPPAGNDVAPPESESAAVAQVLDEFPGVEEQSVIIVLTPDHGGALTGEDDLAIDALTRALAPQYEVSGPMISADERAAVLISPITVGVDNSETSLIINDLREQIAAADLPLTAHVTGGPAFGADIAGAF